MKLYEHQTKPTKISFFKISFFKSLWAFILLSLNGFRISRSSGELEIFRFFWKGYVIDDMADIDKTGKNSFSTMYSGRSKKL